MRWDRGHRSRDVIDRRGAASGGGRGLGGGRGGLGLFVAIGSRFGIGGIVVAVLAFFGLQYCGGGAGLLNLQGGTQDEAPIEPRQDDEAGQFVGFVLDDIQNTWTELFRKDGQTYERAKLVLFTDRTSTGCGTGEAVTGPFYCPADRRAYLDLSFFRQLKARLGAPGDFAQAYVIAHEVGHHIQNLLGASAMVHRAPKREQEGAGGLSVRLELQADCYAGVWAHATSQRAVLEAGDLQEALGAAQAIGDDTLQKQAGRAVQPESWSHGSSAQRQRWFQRGFDSGEPDRCDTFSASSL